LFDLFISTPSSNFFNATTVPYQDNGWDCGVFVCRYASAIYEIRHVEFSRGTAQLMDGGNPFNNLISNNHHFCFGMADIAAMRREMKVLIQRLALEFASQIRATVPKEETKDDVSLIRQQTCDAERNELQKEEDKTDDCVLQPYNE
jgi:hypothetical protein